MKATVKWPPWAYGLVGAGYALATGFSAIYVAPSFMGTPPLELDEANPPTESASRVQYAYSFFARIVCYATCLWAGAPPGTIQQVFMGIWQCATQMEMERRESPFDACLAVTIPAPPKKLSIVCSCERS